MNDYCTTGPFNKHVFIFRARSLRWKRTGLKLDDGNIYRTRQNGTTQNFIFFRYSIGFCFASVEEGSFEFSDDI